MTQSVAASGHRASMIDFNSVFALPTDDRWNSKDTSDASLERRHNGFAMRHLCIFLLLFASLLFADRPYAASEMEDRAIISSVAQQAFLAEDFSQLERVSRDYRTSKARTSSGLWKLTIFYAGIGGAISAHAKTKIDDEGPPSDEQEVAFRELEGITERWARRYPDSPSAYIALSMVHIGHAWAYRGPGYASTVKPEAWTPFQKYVALARQSLEAHKSVAAGDPRWYETMLVVARAENWKRDRFDSLLEEALDKEPLFYQTYFSALEYLLPKWHGGMRDLEEFARYAVERTSKEEGRGMYARIYWDASQTEFGNELFTGSFAAWPRMKEGFEDIIARYPDAWNFNNYAKFACLADDKPKTRELLKRTESAIVFEAWQPQSLLRQCSDWAFRG
jgi:hypothetical protein